MNIQNLTANLMHALDLQNVPTAVSFLTEQTSNTPTHPHKKVAAGCQFWHEGSTSTVMSSAHDHQNCSIGVYTHNFKDTSSTQAQELTTSIDLMKSLGYLNDYELQHIPTLKQAVRFIEYSPLRECASAPDLVLVFADSQQGLIITEASYRVDQAYPLVMGRPACAALPQAMNTQNAVLSLGCCGARTYLNSFSNELGMWVLPGTKLQAYCDAIQTFTDTNTALKTFHRSRFSDIEQGITPTVQETFQKIQQK